MENNLDACRVREIQVDAIRRYDDEVRKLVRDPEVLQALNRALGSLVISPKGNSNINKYKEIAEYNGFSFDDLLVVANAMALIDVDNIEYLKLMLDKNRAFFEDFLS